jgi:hypothetical protein
VRTASRWRLWLARWPGWIGYVAAAWSLMYGLLGLWWALGGAGFPFGRENDPDAALSVLADVQTETGARVIAALGLASAVAAVAMARTRGRGTLGAVLLVFAWAVTVVLALAIPDYRVLMAVTYAPIVLIGAPFGWPLGVDLIDAFPWPVVNQFVCIGAGSCGRRRPWPTGAGAGASAATAAGAMPARSGPRRTRRRGGGGGPSTSRWSCPYCMP